MKVGNLPRGYARTRPDELAVIHEDTQITFSQFYENLKHIGQNFLNMGLKFGDRVGILTRNCPEILYSFYAFPNVGAITTPFNFSMSAKEILYCVKDCTPRFLIYQPEFEETIQLIKQNSSSVEHFIPTTQFQTIIHETPDSPLKRLKFSKHSTAYILWTGGTTGFPKGVMISHYNILTMIAMAGEMLIRGTEKFKESLLTDTLSKMLTALPLFHGAGLFISLCCMFGGITFITQGQFDVINTLKTIEKEKVSSLALVPTMLKRFIESPELPKYDLRTLETIIYGAAPITPTILGKALDIFPNADFIQVFGQTEASPVLCIMGALDHATARTNRKLLASCGRALSGIEIKVVDADCCEVACGEVGEIIARGNNIMQGYWQKPDKTAQTVRDGWLHTGDLGKMDEEGFIYITGRGKDLIISGGENIYPLEVEDALLSHPAVLECAVIGIPDENWGEAVTAFVILQPGVKEGLDVTEEELINHVKSRIASYKKPQNIYFKRKLPKSPQGKILKRKIREPFWKDKARQVH
ncbi:MAG: AMP-binding protein [Candidatus Helarchaeota archaeon]|nr:AMP-binding protein [Candidatus Helarchaeota archaeon]